MAVALKTRGTSGEAQTRSYPGNCIGGCAGTEVSVRQLASKGRGTKKTALTMVATPGRAASAESRDLAGSKALTDQPSVTPARNLSYSVAVVGRATAREFVVSSYPSSTFEAAATAFLRRVGGPRRAPCPLRSTDHGPGAWMDIVTPRARAARASDHHLYGRALKGLGDDYRRVSGGDAAQSNLGDGQLALPEPAQHESGAAEG